MATETRWIVIEEEDLDDYLVGAQMQALKTAALGVGQDDPFDRVMQDIASRIRAEVRGCTSNQVSNLPNSIPPDLKSAACNLIIEAMQGRLSGGGALPLTQDQKDACNEARKYLARIADCKVPIAQPTDPENPPTVQFGDQIEQETGNKPVMTRESMDGL